MRDVAYIALGSNLGDRDGYLTRARAALGGLSGSRIVAESEVEETPPIGPSDQPAYLNQMVALETSEVGTAHARPRYRIVREHSSSWRDSDGAASGAAQPRFLATSARRGSSNEQPVKIPDA
jgi:hypothetical protein